MAEELILIFDFGSQFVHLIARRVREFNVFCQIVRHDLPASRVAELKPRGIIFSGGPFSVYESGAPHCDPALFDLDIPILAICYGLQLAAHLLGGEVAPHPHREFGHADLTITDPDDVLAGVSNKTVVWMSHGDQLVPHGDWATLASTPTCPVAAARHTSKPIHGIQFHPEVSHTREGIKILRNFLYDICGCRGTWKMSAFIDRTVADIRQTVGSKRVICGLSGGVDSSVTAALLFRAVGKQVACMVVANGLLCPNGT